MTYVVGVDIASDKAPSPSCQCGGCVGDTSARLQRCLRSQPAKSVPLELTHSATALAATEVVVMPRLGDRYWLRMEGRPTGPDKAQRCLVAVTIPPFTSVLMLPPVGITADYNVLSLVSPRLTVALIFLVPLPAQPHACPTHAVAPSKSVSPAVSDRCTCHRYFSKAFRLSVWCRSDGREIMNYRLRIEAVMSREPFDG